MVVEEEDLDLPIEVAKQFDIPPAVTAGRWGYHLRSFVAPIGQGVRFTWKL